MVKSTFQQTYDRTIKFYDFQYHLHKSSFKGLASWMKNYSQCEKSYAEKLFDLSKDMKQYIPEMALEISAVKNSINDLIQSVSTMSQLHFNYSQRLTEVSYSLTSEYSASKKIKEKHMKVLKDQFEQKINAARETKNRNKITSQEAHICKSLFEHLDTYAEQQFGRTQKFKQQILIYFALTKKYPFINHRIQQKQLEITSKFKGRISQEQIEVKINKIDEISSLLTNQYNSYIENQSQIEKLVAKKYEKIQNVQILRQSLKESTILREKINNLDAFKNRLTQSLKNYERIPENYVQFNLSLRENSKLTGIFDTNLLKKSASYSNLFKTQTFIKLSYSMFTSYFAKSKDPQTRVILLTIKGSLKIGGESMTEYCNSFSEFTQKQLSKRLQMQINPFKSQQIKDLAFHIGFLVIISELYFTGENEFRQKDFITEEALMSFIKTQNYNVISTLKHKNFLHINISSAIIKILLSSLIQIQEDEPLLSENFAESVNYISKFALEYLNLNQNIVKLLFLELVQNAIRSTKNKYVQEIHALIESPETNPKNTSRKGSSQQDHQEFDKRLTASLIVKITEGIVSFYKLGIPLINFFTILICVQKLAQQKFSAVEYFHKCLKRAGHAYILWIDEQKKIIDPTMRQGEMRLKNLIETLQKLEYEQLQEAHFLPTSLQMARILGVDQSVIMKKIKQEFLESLGDMIEQNIDLLFSQQGIDKEGYVLKLGVILAQLDIPTFKNIDFQNKYLRVLDLYLSNTEKEYNNLLDHSRKTQLWIMEENCLATQNCIDFCSLLYKPFEFLLKTIKIISHQNKTAFTNGFSQFIKNKLNTILKDQICKYINFLNDSLRQYNNEQPEIHYKLKRSETVVIITEEETAKTKEQFKEIIRRLYNLNFLKDQLNDIIHDFLEQDVSEDLGQSIFNLSSLSKATTKYKQYRQILANLTDIVKTIAQVEQKLICRVSDITVFHCMRRLFYNLYFQEQKSTFEQFFSTKNDYKLSVYTFVNFQKYFEDFFSFVQKHIPTLIQEKYYQRMTGSFFKALKYQILNSNKFKLPKAKQQIVRYLDQDISFICTLLKQKYISPQTIEIQLQKPLKKLLSTLQASTKDLIQKIQTETLSNNNQQCKYILIILYMRSNDEKAQQFFKKFKHMIFK